MTEIERIEIAGVDLEHHEIDAGEVCLHAVAAGPEDGRPLVLLHGFPEFWYGWRHQIVPLAEAGFRVWAPDQRGYNRSERPRRVRDYRLDALASDVTGLLDALGLERAAVVGHDWGAAVAWWLAARNPERVERLAILNVPHPLVMRRFLLKDRAQRRRSWYIFFFQLPLLPEVLLGRRNFSELCRMLRGGSRRGTFSDADLERYRDAWGRPRALGAMIDWYRASVRHPSRLPDPRVRVPTRILWGAQDIALGREMVPPSLELCDRGEAIYLEDAGHFVQHEEPEEVTRRLIEFLSSPAKTSR